MRSAASGAGEECLFVRGGTGGTLRGVGLPTSAPLVARGECLSGDGEGGAARRAGTDGPRPGTGTGARTGICRPPPLAPTFPPPPPEEPREVAALLSFRFLSSSSSTQKQHVVGATTQNKSSPTMQCVQTHRQHVTEETNPGQALSTACFF